jgi:hypothetical protein
MANTPPYDLVCTDTGYGGNWDCVGTGFTPNQTYTLSIVTETDSTTTTIQADRFGNIRFVGGPSTTYSVTQGVKKSGAENVLAFFQTGD